MCMTEVVLMTSQCVCIPQDGQIPSGDSLAMTEGMTSIFFRSLFTSPSNNRNYGVQNIGFFSLQQLVPISCSRWTVRQSERQSDSHSQSANQSDKQTHNHSDII